MANLKLEFLPILLVSAKDQNTATTIISEFDSNYALRSSEDNIIDCVWRIVNKYYTADVRLHALLDGQELDSQLVDSVEAHLIYMSEDECTGTNAVEVMRERARAISGAHVRVVAADTAQAVPLLAGACATDRLELVPLREAPGDDDDPEEYGLARVRAAFHAHIWPGLVRRGCDEAAEAARSEGSESESEWSEWCSGPAGFAAALGALPAAAAAARASPSRAERLARAEQLVAAFCRALGTPLDSS